MALDPLERFVSFWKPLLTGDELRALACYRDPDDPRVPGVNVWNTASESRPWRVTDGDDSFLLYAAVQPIDEAPPGTEVLAEILDPAGAHHSYVLWFPAEGAIVVPFDPNAAIESFLREEYVPAAERTALPQPLLNLYYAVAKPLMPKSIKRRLRTSMAHRALGVESALRWPSDESLDALQRLLLKSVLLASGLPELRFVWFWPDGHPWAAILTHDVESSEGAANVTRVAELETARGLKSSFNFVPLDYDVPAPLLDQLRDTGFEIGVHGDSHDGLLFSSRSTFEHRVGTINETARAWQAVGFRSPATYRNPDWMRLLELEYDSSYSNSAPCEPQPGGCGSFFPFLMGSLTELPITLPQDHTLYGLFEQSDAGTWLTVLERIRRAGGMACVLTHPDPGAGYIGFPGNDAHYTRLLDEVAGSGAWTPLPRDLARWWRARDAISPAQIESMAEESLGCATLGADGRLAVVAPAPR